MRSLFKKPDRIAASLALLFGLAAMPCNLKGQTLSFLRQLSGPQQSESPIGIVADSSSVYVATWKAVGRYDATGGEIWIHPIEGPVVITSVAPSGSGVYVAGNVAVAVSPGQEQPVDGFVSRYDADGNELWMRQFRGAGPLNRTSGITADETGAYVTGNFGISSGGTNASFLRKYDAAGNESWTRQLNFLALSSQSIAVDTSSIYIAGLILSPTGGGALSSVLAKYGLDGSPGWTTPVGPQSYPIPVRADASGVYVVNTSQTLSYIRKYDAGGGEIWTNTLPASAFSLAIDSDGVYVAGATSTVLPGQCSAGLKDQYVIRFDRDGTEVWTRQFGSYRDDSNAGIAVNPSGIYVTGSQPSGPAVPVQRILAKLEKEPAAADESRPRIRWECVVNAGSFTGGAVAPGEIVTIFGMGIGPPRMVASDTTGAARIPTQLGGTRILFNGVAGPLLYVSAQQSTAIVPGAVAGNATVEVQVEYLGVRSPAVTLPVLDSRIGVFSLDASGAGQAAAINSDGSVNSLANPAAKGGVLSVYATGGGLINMGLSDEQIRGDATATLAGRYAAVLGTPDDEYVYDGYDCEVIYAGEVAGSVEGLLRFDVRVPGYIPSGVWNIRLFIGDPYQLMYGDLYNPKLLPSQKTVTVAVR